MLYVQTPKSNLAGFIKQLWVKEAKWNQLHLLHSSFSPTYAFVVEIFCRCSLKCKEFDKRKALYRGLNLDWKARKPTNYTGCLFTRKNSFSGSEGVLSYLKEIIQHQFTKIFFHIINNCCYWLPECFLRWIFLSEIWL